MNRQESHLEETNIKEFSLIGFFAVTGICFFLFSFVMKLLNGSYISLFNKVGSTCTVLAVILLIVKLIMPGENKQAAGTSTMHDE